MKIEISQLQVEPQATDAHASAGAQEVSSASVSETRNAEREWLGWVVRLSETRVNGLAGLVADVGISLILLYAGARYHMMSAPLFVLTFGAGLLLSSFAEYCVHRWLFHGAEQILQRGHTQHHIDPHGYDSLPFFLPPLIMLAIAASFSMLLRPPVALVLAGGLASGYAAYGLAHSAIHARRFGHSVARRWAALHHIHHNHPGHNFGVTSPLWDLLLGTRYKSKSVRTQKIIDAAQQS